MKKRSLISVPITSEDIQRFADGYPSERQTRAVRIAWLLENEAVRQGWPVGQSLGSETDLSERFGINRDRMREVVRILEARGAMRMQRGRRGGLCLVRPDPDRIGQAFSLYLRSRGYSAVDARTAQPITDALLAELPATSCLVKIFDHTCEALFNEDSATAAGPARSIKLAARLIEASAEPLPTQSEFIGSADALSDRFHASRATTRAMLQILDDVGALRVKRGRGGGYSIGRPSSIGIIRHMFILLAAQRASVDEIVRSMWSLNLMQVRLAMQRLQSMSPTEREAACRGLALEETAEPRRWTMLQMRIASIAKDEMIGALQECLAAYLGRLGLPSIDCAKLEADLLKLEAAIVASVRSGDGRNAECQQRAAQSLLSECLRSTEAAHARR